MKKVVLFLPAYPGKPLGPPVGLLSLASILMHSNYKVQIIDPAVTPNYMDAVKFELDSAICFGVSLLTGPMIADAIRVSCWVKSLRPNLPVIFGGWHPSLLPEQTLKESYVDIVIRGQGEVTLLEVVRYIDNNKDLDGVLGCSFKKGGMICHNPDRPVVPLKALPGPAYDLVDFGAYEKITGERKLPYASSVGCPYACNYCTDSVFYGRRFNAQTPQRVIEEVASLVTKRSLQQVALLDSNFLVDGQRALQIARGFLDLKLGFRWTFQTSADLLCRLSDEEVLLLGKSGVAHIGLGAESGSMNVLSAMNKQHQRIYDFFEAARKCFQASIRATFNLIFGFPGETEQDLSQTFKVMSDISSQFINVTFSANIFTPYPGIFIWPELKDLGVKEPFKLEEWIPLSLGTNVLPWLNGKTCRKIKKGISLFKCCSKVTKKIGDSSLSPTERWILLGIHKSLCFRMRYRFFEWPLEQWLIENKIGF